MVENTLKVVMVGDLVLDCEDVDTLFDATRAVLRDADVTIGQVEVPYTLNGDQVVFASPAPKIDPAQLDALASAGFDVCTLAGNHIFDRGAIGIQDTLDALQGLGISTVGAGLDIAKARRPAIVERDGTSIGVLDYNCVGTRETWATAGKPGCAYVRVLSHYELDYASPGSTPEAFTFAEPASLRRMEEDIRALREQVDVVIVALHKGLVHTPATVADYELQVSHAAVDAGADVVIGHHAHVLEGIEVYRGTPIFHGLGNFVTTTHALDIAGNTDVDAAAWAKRRRALFGFEPTPGYEKYPFHPEAKNAMIATVRIAAGEVVSAGYIPCWVGPDAQPVPHGDDTTGRQVAAYVEDISRRSGFDTRFAWNGDQVVLTDITPSTTRTTKEIHS